MKKSILSSFAVALTFGCLLSVQTASAQDTPAPSRVGLIDMAHVFKNYDKFKALRDDLKAEIQNSDQQAKSMAAHIKTVQDQMKAFTEGTPEYLQHEKELAKLVSDFEAFRKVAQRDFMRKEADIYKTVYLEIADAVKLYAQHYKIRFDLAVQPRGHRLLEQSRRSHAEHEPPGGVFQRQRRH